MKKNEIKGLSVFELLEGLDDDMIASAALPEEEPAVSLAPKKRSPIMDFLSSGWVAATAGAVAGVAVLAGVILLWRPWDDPLAPPPPGTDPGEINSAPDTNHPDDTPTPPTHTALSVVSGGDTVYPGEYTVSIEENYHDENGVLHQVAADGLPVEYQLDKVVNEVPRLHTGGHGFSVTLDAHEKLNGLSVFLVEDIQNGVYDRKVLQAHGGEEDPLARLTELPGGEYLVVLSVSYKILYPNDEYERGVTDYAFLLTVDPSLSEDVPLSVVSDGATVHPKGYCVYVSGQQIGADGELVHFDGDGPGAVTRLEEIAEEIPSLRTGGNSYVLLLPSNTSVQRLRVFAVSESRPDGWAPILDCSAEQSGGRDLVTRLKGLSDGRYMVVLNAVYSSYASENEYKRGEDEYAFFLTVDSSMDAAFPVRVIHGDKTYFPTDYTLEKIYYDAEQQKEIVQKYDGAVKILGELTDDMPTATVVRGESLSLYLAPFYDLRTVRIFRSDLTEWVEAGTDNPLDHISGWEAGEYYAVITAVYLGTGESEISEFPVRVCLVEPKE